VRDGQPLDLRLAILAAGAGVVDVISLTVLGAFTAAVTADLVFVGIAIEDGDIHTAARAALAIAAFGTGALVAMRFVAGASAERRRFRGAAVLAGIARSSSSGSRPRLSPRASSSTSSRCCRPARWAARRLRHGNGIPGW
jgi:hypothetical protein